DPGRLLEYGVRFTRPVVVDDQDGADIEVSAKVASVADGLIGVDLSASYGGQTVLARAKATVRSA
ncbi:MAG: acyl dehydratase, partial [Actinobacteria bacterium]|nr:acyl dehydratase [Actinomycetota bacterium]